VVKELVMTEKVELFNALRWDCPECGRENFDRCIHLEAAHLEQFLHLVSDESELILYPGDVQCKHCNEKFEAEYVGLGEEND